MQSFIHLALKLRKKINLPPPHIWQNKDYYKFAHLFHKLGILFWDKYNRIPYWDKDNNRDKQHPIV